MTYGYNHGEPIQNTPALAWLDSLDQLFDSSQAFSISSFKTWGLQ